ncbi:glycosyltransferase [Azospirillum picis]|uniref:Glycosyltransferase involved in cell wall biosynthesis n=1 Tax=Azospirillum picis TaxID=488438 RepID=A0ABU0MTU3_9PROT|nr:glycosyltransferase [Azospirillum picis]MBP2303045.1 glycosyltransferase involved in cell wall biosynthesis [Azospirillum picis]MDQ0536841.1 glycosyltransferase involved in cell wall biosynthesis [Azospirillum picis]
MDTPLPPSVAAPPGVAVAGTTAIIVLGMHRSGTSALTRAVNILGAAVPSNLYPALPSNPLGHWESNDLIALHDEILASVGLAYDGLGPFPQAWFATPQAEAMVDRLVGVLHRDFAGAPLFVLKDPRICRLVPLWLRVLARFGARPVFLVPIRHPFEVAGSLFKRNGFSREKSLLLWLRHMAEAEPATRGQERCFLTYDALLADWRRTLGQAGQALRLAWPQPFERVADQMGKELSPVYRNNRAADDEQALEAAAPWVARLYRALHRLVADPADRQACAAIDAVREALGAGDPLFAPLLASQAPAPLPMAAPEPDEPPPPPAVAPGAGHEAAPAHPAPRPPADGPLLAWIRAKLPPDRHTAETMALVRESGLFDPHFYLDSHPDLRQGDIDPLRHFVEHGGAEGRRPNPLFDSVWYGDRHGITGNPLVHYLTGGEAAGNRPNPVFDPAWYRQAYAPAGSPLADYLTGGRQAGRWPNALFDPAWYRQAYEPAGDPLLEYLASREDNERRPNALFDVAWYRATYQPAADPLDDYQAGGWQAGRRPNALFDVAWYRATYQPPGDPLADYLASGAAAGRRPNALFDVVWYRQTYEPAADPLVDYLAGGSQAGRRPNRLFDVTWYRETYRPEQEPLVDYLHGGSAAGRWPNALFDPIWYRTTYQPGDDPLADYLFTGPATGRWPNALFDPVWYRATYHPTLDPLEDYLSGGVAAGRWPNALFDPVWYRATYQPDAEPLHDYLRPGRAHERKPNPIFEPVWYGDGHAEHMRGGEHPLAHYLREGGPKGWAPAWLFDPGFYRTQPGVDLADGQDALAHYLWTGAARGLAPHPIFTGQVRAGEGAAEGAALAPGWLEHCAATLSRPAAAGVDNAPVLAYFRQRLWRHPQGRRRLVAVSHDASRTGAPLYLLRLLQQLAAEQPELDIAVLLIGGGPLAPAFARLGPTFDLYRYNRAARVEAEQALHELSGLAAQATVALCNTVVADRVAEALSQAGVPVLSVLHETPASITEFYGAERVRRIAASARRIVAVSDVMRDALIASFGLAPDQVSRVHGGLVLNGLLHEGAGERAMARAALRRSLALPEAAVVVLACGTPDLRKGFDLAVQMAKELRGGAVPIHIVWVGGALNPDQEHWARFLLRVSGVEGVMHWLGPTDNPAPLYLAADLFLLPSREDPFPLVVIEAMAAGLPVVAFAQAGGAVEAIAACGVSVPLLDLRALRAAIEDLAGDPERRQALGAAARQRVLSYLTFERVAREFTELMDAVAG